MKKLFLMAFAFTFYSGVATAEMDIWCADNLASWYGEAELKQDRASGLNDDQICHFYPRRPLISDIRWLPDTRVPFLFTLRTKSHLFVMDTRYYDAISGRRAGPLHFNWNSLASTPWTEPFKWDGGRVGGYQPTGQAPYYFHKEIRETMDRLGMDSSKYKGGERLWVDGASPRLTEKVVKDPSRTAPLSEKSYIGQDEEGRVCSIDIRMIDQASQPFPLLEVKTNYSSDVLVMVPGSQLDRNLDHMYELDRFWAGHLIKELVINTERAYNVELFLNGDLKEPVKFRVKATDSKLAIDQDRSHLCTII